MARHFPAKLNSTSTGRRRFINRVGLGALGSFVAPQLSLSAETTPPDSFGFLSSQDTEESYWEMVKKQFTVRPGTVMANSANLCPSPYFVNEKTFFYTKELAKDVSFQHRSMFGQIRGQAIEHLASYVGASTKEVGISRNTSEANNIVVNGVDFKEGDEVILWDQNHPSNLASWKHRALRHGFKVVEVSTPQIPTSADQLAEVFLSAISPRTRLISFSHISNVSGIALPARHICHNARDLGILTLVDGAQSFGFLDLNLKDMGCSYYTASSHKWLMGPMENGLLYVNSDNPEKIWPNIIGAGWQADRETVDDYLCNLGQRNTPSTSSMPDILAFHRQIGKKKVEKRVYQLNTHLKNALAERFPDILFTTPISESLSGGVTIFNFPDTDFRNIFDRLYSEHGIASAPMDGIRISPTINSTLDDMNTIVDALGQIV